MDHLILPATMSISASYEFSAQAQAQEPDIDNSYINIPKDIKDFQTLSAHAKFSAIKQQYIDDIGKLESLYYYFTGLILDGSDGLQETQKKYLTDDETDRDNDNILFCSYSAARAATHNLVKYLNDCKNKNIKNNQTAIICAGLKDCIACLNGFNSKIMQLDLGLSYYLTNDLSAKIKFKIETFIKSIICELLMRDQENYNIHHQNYFFNLIADNYSLTPCVESLIISQEEEIVVDRIHNEITRSITKYDICNRIADELCNQFKNTLNTIGKSEWINNNYITNVARDVLDDIENLFIRPLEEYLGVKLEEPEFGISNFIIDHQDHCSISMDGIKYNLHRLVAKHIDKSPNFFKKFINDKSESIEINNNLSIVNINNGFFVVLDSKKNEGFLRLSYLQIVDYKKFTTEVFGSMLIQALTYTFASVSKEFYTFFNHRYISDLFFKSKKFLPYLSKAIDNDIDLKNKILNDIVLASIYDSNDITKYSVLLNFIENDIMTADIIKTLLDYEDYDIHISYFLAFLSSKQIDNIMGVLNADSIKKIIEVLSNSNLDTEIKNTFCKAIVNYCDKSINPLIAILNSELKDYFLSSLTPTQKGKFLPILLNHRITNESINSVIFFFTEDYIKLEIIDNNNNNLLHHIIMMDNSDRLDDIKENYTITKLLTKKNNENLTPLMLAAKTGKFACLQQLLELHSLKMLEARDYQNNNSLMLAIRYGNDECAVALIEKSNDTILSQRNLTYDHHNALNIAIKYNRPYINQLINKTDKSIIASVNRDDQNTLMFASTIQNISSNTIDLLIAKCRELALYKQKETGYNALMISIKNQNITMFNCLLEQRDVKKYLTERSREGKTAIEHAYTSVPTYFTEFTQKTHLQYLVPTTNNIPQRKIKFISSTGNKALILEQAKNGDYVKLQQLLTVTAKKILKATDKENNNSLMLAIIHGHDDCAIALLQHNFSKSILEQKNTNGNNALQLAIRLKRPYIDQIIKKSSKKVILATDQNGNNNLMTAIMEGVDKNIIDLLIARCPEFISKENIKLKDKKGANAIVKAVQYQNLYALQRLAPYTTAETINTPDSNNCNALMYAIDADQEQCVEELLKIITNHKSFDQINYLKGSALTVAIHHDSFYVPYLIDKTSVATIMTKNIEDQDCIEKAISMDRQCTAVRLIIKLKQELPADDFKKYRESLLQTIEGNQKPLLTRVLEIASELQGATLASISNEVILETHIKLKDIAKKTLLDESTKLEATSDA